MNRELAIGIVNDVETKIIATFNFLNLRTSVFFEKLFLSGKSVKYYFMLKFHYSFFKKTVNKSGHMEYREEIQKEITQDADKIGGGNIMQILYPALSSAPLIYMCALCFRQTVASISYI